MPKQVKQPKKVKNAKAEHSLITAAKEMLAHARGEIELPSYHYTPPPKVDVAEIRKRLGLSQKDFADHYGFAVSALKDWEQGRRNPERSTRILLALINAEPQLVEKTLAQISV